MQAWLDGCRLLSTLSARGASCQVQCLVRVFHTFPNWRQQATHRVELRPYQEDSIQSVLNYLKNGEKRLGISLATGGGKTVVFSHLIERVPCPTPEATQSLVLAHRRELVDQAASHCRKLYPDKTVDIEMGKQHASGIADITVASVQSIIAGDRLRKYDPLRMKLVLIDEAHHAVAPSYLQVLEHFNLVGDRPRGVAALVGVSATLSRADGLKLGAVLDHIVYHKDYIDLIEDKFLSDVRFTTVESGANLSKIKTAHGDFQTGALSRAVNTPEVNEVTVRSWLAIAKKRKSTLVFCVDLAHVAALTKTYRDHGYDARFVTSHTRPQERAERLEAFRAGNYPVLINCGIYTEGTDIPNIDCVLLARPTKSRNLLIQMMGRGLRRSTGKQDCHIIDMVGSLAKGIVTTPTLFGLDPHEIVEDATVAALKEKREKQEEMKAAAAGEAASLRNGNPGFTGNVTFTHFDSVNSLIEHTSGERHIRGMSRLAWVQVDDTRYILSDRSGSFLTLEMRDGGYLVTFTGKLTAPSEKSKTPFRRPVTIATTSTLEHAINAADTFARKRFVVPMVLARAAWRQGDATPQQLVFLNRFRADGDQLQPGSINKGSAADSITKLKFGARGRFKRLQKKKAEAEKVEASKTHDGPGPLNWLARKFYRC